MCCGVYASVCVCVCMCVCVCACVCVCMCVCVSLGEITFTYSTYVCANKYTCTYTCLLLQNRVKTLPTFRPDALAFFRASGRNVGKVFNPVLKLVVENYPFSCLSQLRSPHFMFTSTIIMYEFMCMFISVMSIHVIMVALVCHSMVWSQI